MDCLGTENKLGEDVVSQTCQNKFFGFFSTQNPKLLPEKLNYPYFSLQIWILRQNSPLVTPHRISITLTDKSAYSVTYDQLQLSNYTTHQYSDTTSETHSTERMNLGNYSQNLC
jgi:hypothetical protein